MLITLGVLSIMNININACKKNANPLVFNGVSTVIESCIG